MIGNFWKWWIYLWHRSWWWVSRVYKVVVAQWCLTLWDPMDPARLLCPWNSPGKNTGVNSHSPVFLPGKSHGQRSLVGYSPWGRKELDMTEQLNFLNFLQGSFPTQGLNPGLLHCRQILYHLSHQGSYLQTHQIVYIKEAWLFFQSYFSKVV